MVVDSAFYKHCLAITLKLYQMCIETKNKEKRLHKGLVTRNREQKYIVTTEFNRYLLQCGNLIINEALGILFNSTVKCQSSAGTVLGWYAQDKNNLSADTCP